MPSLTHPHKPSYMYWCATSMRVENCIARPFHLPVEKKNLVSAGFELGSPRPSSGSKL